MNGAHSLDIVWFNPKKVLPDSNRQVLVLFTHFFGRGAVENRIAQARLIAQDKFLRWDVDSHFFNPSVDIVTQWAEILPERSGIMPDPFPTREPLPEFISNKSPLK